MYPVPFIERFEDSDKDDSRSQFSEMVAISKWLGSESSARVSLRMAGVKNGWVNVPVSA
jgi:hypothetical protein